jgi:hypothetical protein
MMTELIKTTMALANTAPTPSSSLSVINNNTAKEYSKFQASVAV